MVFVVYYLDFKHNTDICLISSQGQTFSKYGQIQTGHSFFTCDSAPHMCAVVKLACKPLNQKWKIKVPH